MRDSKLTFKDFELEIISKKEQKTIKGGGNVEEDVNPGKVGGGGNT